MAWQERFEQASSEQAPLPQVGDELQFTGPAPLLQELPLQDDPEHVSRRHVTVQQLSVALVPQVARPGSSLQRSEIELYS